MPNWTPSQQDAIADRGHSLIVCAAAGSGKTAVLVERIVQLLCEGTSIENMLIVTFTNAAAGEMRLRIGEALNEAAAKRPELADQIMALSHASISTLHRFCAGLLREHFEALGIDAGFRIGDEQECGVLSRQAMDDALYACYDVGEEDFLAADERFEQEELASMAMAIDRFMKTRPDPEAWLARSVSLCEAGGEEMDLSFLLAAARAEIGGLLRMAKETLELCTGDGGPEHYRAACEDDVVLAGDLLAAAEKGYAALHPALTDVEFAGLGRKKKGIVFDEDIAEEIKARRDAFKKGVKALAEQFSSEFAEEQADIRMTAAPLRGILSLVRTYEALYTAAKRQRGIMDFDDLEHGALEALTHEEVREALARKYRYVFVDEYQDSSAIQEAILGSFAPADGQFLVGDVKQSIYRFRQAEPGLFLEKAQRFDRPEETLSRRIDLQNNFRSRANVLAASNAVFERIMRRGETEIEYDERERLIPGLPVREDDPPVELHILYKGEEPEETEDFPQEEGGEEEQERELAAAEREAVICARRIHELVGSPYFDQKQGRERPLTYRDMVVLMRVTHGTAPLAADILQSEGIPVFCDAGEGYFDIPEIRTMMALLKTIASGAQDEALLAALRGPALGLTDAELAAIRIHTPDVHIPYREAVRRYREECEDALAEKLRGFQKRIAFWRLCSRHQGVDRLIERIYAETGFVAQAGALPGGRARQANLHLLTARARSFMTSQGGSLGAFLRYAERLHAGGDNMNASAIGESEDVVRIMTTHKSKGLEFPVVFILGMGRGMNMQYKNAKVLMSAGLGIGLPCVDMELHSERDTLLRKAIRAQQQGEQLAEEIRILYVAMTRARDRLIMIGDSKLKEPAKKWAPDSGLRGMRCGLDMVCPMLAANGATFTAQMQEIAAGDSRWQVFTHDDVMSGRLGGRTDEAVQALLKELEAAPPPDEEMLRLLSFVPGQGQAAVRKTSVSAVLRDEKRLADDELHQHDVEVQRLPRFMTERSLTGAQIGTAFHRMMCMLDLDALKAADNLEQALSAQHSAMLEDGVITGAEYDAVPVKLLTGFFAGTLGQRLLKAGRVEREWAFTWKRVNDAGETQLLQGVIDCCFIERGKWVLVDYKTDSAHDIPAVLEKHRPQLALYAQALSSITEIPVRERMLYLVRAGISLPI